MKATLTHDTKAPLNKKEIKEHEISSWKLGINTQTNYILHKHIRIYVWEGMKPFSYIIFPHENVV
jgi:hypothetical protein